MSGNRLVHQDMPSKMYYETKLNPGDAYGSDTRRQSVPKGALNVVGPFAVMETDPELKRIGEKPQPKQSRLAEKAKFMESWCRSFNDTQIVRQHRDQIERDPEHFRFISALSEWREYMYHYLFLIASNFCARTSDDATLSEGPRVPDLSHPDGLNIMIIKDEKEYDNCGWGSFPSLQYRWLTESCGRPLFKSGAVQKEVWDWIHDGFTKFVHMNRTSGIWNHVGGLWDISLNPCSGDGERLDPRSLYRMINSPMYCAASKNARIVNDTEIALESVDLLARFLIKKISEREVVRGKESEVGNEDEEYAFVVPCFKPSQPPAPGTSAAAAAAAASSSSAAAAGASATEIEEEEGEIVELKEDTKEDDCYVLKASEFTLRRFWKNCAGPSVLRSKADLLRVLRFYRDRFLNKNGVVDVRRRDAHIRLYLELRLLAFQYAELDLSCEYMRAEYMHPSLPMPLAENFHESPLTATHIKSDFNTLLRSEKQREQLIEELKADRAVYKLDVAAHKRHTLRLKNAYATNTPLGFGWPVDAKQPMVDEPTLLGERMSIAVEAWCFFRWDYRSIHDPMSVVHSTYDLPQDPTFDFKVRRELLMCASQRARMPWAVEVNLLDAPARFLDFRTMLYFEDIVSDKTVFGGVKRIYTERQWPCVADLLGLLNSLKDDAGLQFRKGADVPCKLVQPTNKNKAKTVANAAQELSTESAAAEVKADAMKVDESESVVASARVPTRRAPQRGAAAAAAPQMADDESSEDEEAEATAEEEEKQEKRPRRPSSSSSKPVSIKKAKKKEMQTIASSAASAPKNRSVKKTAPLNVSRSSICGKAPKSRPCEVEGEIVGLQANDTAELEESDHMETAEKEVNMRGIRPTAAAPSSHEGTLGTGSTTATPQAVVAVAEEANDEQGDASDHHADSAMVDEATAEEEPVAAAAAATAAAQPSTMTASNKKRNARKEKKKSHKACRAMAAATTAAASGAGAEHMKDAEAAAAAGEHFVLCQVTVNGRVGNHAPADQTRSMFARVDQVGKDGQPKSVFWIYSMDDLLFERADVLGQDTQVILKKHGFGAQDRAMCTWSQPCSKQSSKRRASRKEVGLLSFELVDAESDGVSLRRVA